MNVDRFLNQRVTHYVKTGVNTHGEPAFASAVTIRARLAGDSRQVVTSDGTTLQSTTKISTRAAIAAGDEIVDADGERRPIMSVTTNVTLDGRTSHYVGLL